MPATLLKMNSFTSIFQEFCWNCDLSFFFAYVLRTPISSSISYLAAVSKSIVSFLSRACSYVAFDFKILLNF